MQADHERSSSHRCLQGQQLKLHILQMTHVYFNQQKYNRIMWPGFLHWDTDYTASPSGTPTTLHHHLGHRLHCITIWDTDYTASPSGTPTTLHHHLGHRLHCITIWNTDYTASPSGTPTTLHHHLGHRLHCITIWDTDYTASPKHISMALVNWQNKSSFLSLSLSLFLSLLSFSLSLSLSLSLFLSLSFSLSLSLSFSLSLSLSLSLFLSLSVSFHPALNVFLMNQFLRWEKTATFSCRPSKTGQFAS